MDINQASELTINTDIQPFEDWLNRYRLHSLPTYFRNGKWEGISCNKCSRAFRGMNKGLRAHEIDGHVSRVDPNDPEASIAAIFIRL